MSHHVVILILCSVWVCFVAVSCDSEPKFTTQDDLGETVDSSITKQDSRAEVDTSFSVDTTTTVVISAALEACATSPLDLMTRDAINPPWRDTETYHVPSTEELNAFRMALNTLLAGDIEAAHTHAASAGYELCGVSSEGLIAALPSATGSGRALVVWRDAHVTDARSVIVEAPHSFFDFSTLEQSAVLFSQAHTRALIASGTHRCANAEASPCSGTTTTCTGGRAPFQISDMAHTERSFFHVAHEVLSDHFDHSVVLSVHGFTDDGVSLSNGTTQPIAPSSPVHHLASRLIAQFPGELITSCNDGQGLMVASRQCGTTNTQGRYVNGSLEACTEASAAASGRFIHMEQSRVIRDVPGGVATALAEAADAWVVP